MWDAMAAFVSKSRVWIRSMYSSFFSHCTQRDVKEKNWRHFWDVKKLSVPLYKGDIADTRQKVLWPTVLVSDKQYFYLGKQLIFKQNIAWIRQRLLFCWLNMWLKQDCTNYDGCFFLTACQILLSNCFYMAQLQRKHY